MTDMAHCSECLKQLYDYKNIFRRRELVVIIMWRLLLLESLFNKHKLILPLWPIINRELRIQKIATT